MRLRHFAQTCALAAALAFAPAFSPAALAHESGHHEPGVAPPGPDMRPAWKVDGPAAYPAPTGYGTYDDPRARDQWLTECRRRLSANDRGRGGAAIGGIAGGLLGNRISGRHHRTVGTIAGAAVGAVAGAAIDRAEDNGRIRDECEAYLDDYYAATMQQQQRYQHVPMMVPVAAPQKCCCTETVETVEYVDVPARRHIPRRVNDKRIRLAPDKRVRTN